MEWNIPNLAEEEGEDETGDDLESLVGTEGGDESGLNHLGVRGVGGDTHDIVERETVGVGGEGGGERGEGRVPDDDHNDIGDLI